MKKILALILLLASPAFAIDTNFMSEGSRLVPYFEGDSNASWTTIDVQGTGDGMEVIFQQPEAATLTQLCLSYNSRQGGDPGAHNLKLQGVTTGTGRADGTTKSSTNASCTIDPSGSGTTDDNKLLCCTMTSSYAASAGELLAINFLGTAGTTASNHGSWNVYQSNSQKTTFPYVWRIAATVATRQSRPPVFAVKSASRTYGTPIASLKLATFNSTAANDCGPDSALVTCNERALAFTKPATLCSTFTVCGAQWIGRVPGTGQNTKLILYSSGTTAGGQATIYGDSISGVGNSSGDHWPITTIFDTPVTFNCGSVARIGIQPQSSTATTAVMELFVSNAAELDAYAFGTNAYSSWRNGGSWTDITTGRLVLDPIICGMTVSSGGGSPGARGTITGSIDR